MEVQGDGVLGFNIVDHLDDIVQAKQINTRNRQNSRYERCKMEVKPNGNTQELWVYKY